MMMMAGSAKFSSRRHDSTSDAEIQVDLCDDPGLELPPSSTDTPKLGPQQHQYKEHSRRIPWFAGCEYRCRICCELFFYVEDLRQHVKNVHRDVHDYLEEYKEFETKARYTTCRLCNEQVKRSFFSFRHHLDRKHKLTLSAYGEKFQLSDYPVTVIEKLSVGEPEDKWTVLGKRPPEADESEKRESKLANINGSDEVFDGHEEQAPKSNWFSGGLYLCQVCDHPHDTHFELLQHVQREHSLTFKNYMETLAVKDAKHQCYICGYSVKHSKRSIKVHVQRSHEIDFDTYKDAFVKRTCQVVLDRHEAEVGGDELKNEGRDSDDGHDEPCSGETSVRNEEQAVEDDCRKYASFQEFITAGSKYECVMCRTFVTKDSQVFWRHILNQHSLNPEDYRCRYGGHGINEAKLKCPSCQVVVNHEPTDLETHARSHGMDVQKCFEAFFPERQELPLVKDMTAKERKAFKRWCNKYQYKCRLCNEYQKEKVILINHLSSHNIGKRGYVKRFGSLRPKTVRRHQCHICHERVLHVQKNLKNHMLLRHYKTLVQYYKEFNSGRKSTTSERRDTTSKVSTVTQGSKGREASAAAWAKQFYWYCKICQMFFPHERAMAAHLKNIHNSNTVNYKNKFGSLSAESKAHRCRICSTTVRHTLPDLERHLHRKHKIKVVQYYEEHIAKAVVDARDSHLQGDNKTVEKVDHKAKYHSVSSAEDSITEKVVHAAKDASSNTEEKRILHPGQSDSIVFESSLSKSATVMEGPRNDRSWMDACSYACKICGAELPSLTMFHRHREQHSPPLNSNLPDYKIPTTSLTMFHCLLCSKMLLHDSESIEAHLKKKHPTVTADEYRATHLRDTVGHLPSVISVHGNAHEHFLAQDTDTEQEQILKQNQQEEASTLMPLTPRDNGTMASTPIPLTPRDNGTMASSLMPPTPRDNGTMTSSLMPPTPRDNGDMKSGE